MTEWQWVGMFGSIILLDLVLSGDNALVLAAAVAQLPRRQRMYALLFGGAGAIILRIILTSIASVIFNIPWIQTIGALILFWIAWRLLSGRSQQQQADKAEKLKTSDATKKMPPSQRSFRAAVLTIFIADVTMSLDNVLAVGAAANGAFLPMSLGLLVSIVIILCGSALIAELMNRFTWLLDTAALVLAWTSGTMIRDDLYTTPIFSAYLHTWPPSIIPIVCCVCMGFILLRFYLHSRATSSNRATLTPRNHIALAPQPFPTDSQIISAQSYPSAARKPASAENHLPPPPVAPIVPDSVRE